MVVRLCGIPNLHNFSGSAEHEEREDEQDVAFSALRDDYT